LHHGDPHADLLWFSRSFVAVVVKLYNPSSSAVSFDRRFHAKVETLLEMMLAGEGISFTSWSVGVSCLGKTVSEVCFTVLEGLPTGERERPPMGSLAAWKKVASLWPYDRSWMFAALKRQPQLDPIPSISRVIPWMAGCFGVWKSDD
jgi:hypothetical protein